MLSLGPAFKQRLKSKDGGEGRAADTEIEVSCVCSPEREGQACRPVTQLRLEPRRPPDNPRKEEIKLHRDSPGKGAGATKAKIC